MAAYGTVWKPDEAAACKAKAEKRALVPGETWGLGFLYRFEDHVYAAIAPYADPVTGDGEWYTTDPRLELTAFLIRSRTPKGWTIEASNGHGWRFIREDAIKRYALPTVELALESYIKRKEKEARLYEARARKARALIKLAQGKTELEFPA